MELCKHRAEGVASGETEETTNSVRSVWAEMGKMISQGYLQRGKGALDEIRGSLERLNPAI